MPRLVIDVGHAPFGRENAYAGFFVAMAWSSVGNEVWVLLRGDGVHAARKGQGDAMKEIGLPPTEKQVRDILGEGGVVIAERGALEARAMAEAQLIEGVRVMDGREMDRLVLENAERFLSF